MANTPDVQTVKYTDDALADIKSFDDAVALLAEQGIAVTDITDFGDGFTVEDKRSLVNVPFIILDYKFADGEYATDAENVDGQFAILRVVTSDGRKRVVTDGGTGIRNQTRQLQRKGVQGGVMCARGLTVSEYDYVDEKTGDVTPAKTYYLGM